MAEEVQFLEVVLRACVVATDIRRHVAQEWIESRREQLLSHAEGLEEYVRAFQDGDCNQTFEVDLKSLRAATDEAERSLKELWRSGRPAPTNTVWLTPEEEEQLRRTANEQIDYAFKAVSERPPLQHEYPARYDSQWLKDYRSRPKRDEMRRVIKDSGRMYRQETDLSRRQPIADRICLMQKLLERRDRHDCAMASALETTRECKIPIRDLARHLVLIARDDDASIETLTQIAALVLAIESDPTEEDVAYLLRP